MTYACSVRRAFDDDDRDACGRTRRRFRCVTNLIFASFLLRPRSPRGVAAADDDGFDAMGVVVNDARIVAFVSIGFGFVRRRVALETNF